MIAQCKEIVLLSSKRKLISNIFSLFQLSFIVQSLRNPDVFCFADYPCHAVVIDILKTAPDDEKRDIAVW